MTYSKGLCYTLEWQELPDAHACRIAAWKADCPLGEESRWRDYQDWFVNRLVAMDAVFRPLIQALP